MNSHVEAQVQELDDEDMTVETSFDDVTAVSEAEQVRRQVRNELLKALKDAENAADKHGFPFAYGNLSGNVQAILLRFCGATVEDISKSLEAMWGTR